jgi:selenocysteine lyase/cysteine desulfurase
VAAVGEVCQERGVPYLVDACQAVGQIPIDVGALGCDYLTATARKFLRGPRGIGFMYVSDRALARGDHPLFVDMRGATWTSLDTYRLEESALRFEEWEAPYALVLGLGAAAEYALAVGVAEAQRRAWALAARLRQRLATLAGATVLDPGPSPCAIVTVSFAGRHARDLMHALRARAINTSATLRWYGLRAFEGTPVESALRLSPHYYNTEAEVDAVVAALSELVGRP